MDDIARVNRIISHTYNGFRVKPYSWSRVIKYDVARTIDMPESAAAKINAAARPLDHCTVPTFVFVFGLGVDALSGMGVSSLTMLFVSEMVTVCSSMMFEAVFLSGRKERYS